MTDGRYYDDGDGRALLSNNLSTSGGLWLWRGRVRDLAPFRSKSKNEVFERLGT